MKCRLQSQSERAIRLTLNAEVAEEKNAEDRLREPRLHVFRSRARRNFRVSAYVIPAQAGTQCSVCSGFPPARE